MGGTLDVRLDEVAQRTMTRARGKEAARALRDRVRAVQASRVYLRISANSVISTSFVDELVQEAAAMERDGTEVVFIVPDGQTLRKLQTSAAWRRVACRYRYQGEEEVRTLQPSNVRDATPAPQAAAKSELPAEF